MDNLNLQVGTTDCPIYDIHLILKEDVIFGDNWSDLARGLGLPSQKIEDLRQEMILNKLKKSDVLFGVVETWGAQNRSSATLSKLLKVVEDDCTATGVGEQLRLRFNLQCKSADDKQAIEWNEVTLPFQKRVIENLRNFFPNVDFVEEDFSTLHGSLLINLMNGNKPRIFKDTIAGKLSYYINRTLITRNIISTSIFEKDFPDIFIFTGMDREELSRLTKHKLTSTSREQLRSGGELTVHYMLLDQASHFDRICGKTNQPVHLIRKEDDGKLRWIRSVGGLENLQSCLSQVQKELDEETFCKTMEPQGTPICISDTPGMGKSILLGQIGMRLIELHPSRTVLFFPLSEFIKLVKLQSGELLDSVEGAKKALETMSCENRIGEAVLKSQMNSQEDSTSMELLLDGFDEIDSADYSFAHTILQTIIISLKSVRIWVTCRPHLLTELESRLGCLGFNIQAFCEDDQVQFLSRYWSRCDQQLIQEKIKEFAHHCLLSLKSKMNANEQDIAGIPLQCLLVGEVYEEDATDYARMDSECTLSSLEIEIGTIANLYQQLIKRKIEKYMSAYGEYKVAELDLMEMHASLSLELLFPDYVQKLELPKPVIVEVLKVGLLESSGETSPTRFIHRTFAEYFIAWFVANNLQRKVERSSSDQIFLEFILERVFYFQDYIEPGIVTFERNIFFSYKFVNIVITHFLNELVTPIQKISCSVAARIHSHSLFNGHLLTKILHACVNDDLTHIFNQFCKEPIFGDSLSGAVGGAEIVLLAIRNAGVDMVKLAWNLCELHEKIDYGMKVSAVNNAAAKANFSVLEFLMKDKQLDQIVRMFEKKEARDLVQNCTAGTSHVPEPEALRHMQILRMFLRFNPALLDKVNWEESSPVVLEFTHTIILISLVSLGADVLGTNDNGETVLHMAAKESRNATDYQKLLLSIPEKKRRQLIGMKDNDGKTPLRALLQYKDPIPETFKEFMNLGVDFSKTDKSSVLAWAIEETRNIDTIRYLMQFVATPNDMNICRLPLSFCKKRRETTLLHIAARKRNVAIIGILVSEIGIDVNAENEYGRTPLDEATRSGYLIDDHVPKMLVCLSSYGARFGNGFRLRDVTSKNHSSITELLQHVQLLIKLGKGANCSDEDGNTPLHWALDEIYGFNKLTIDCNNELIQLLLENDANPKAKNKKGETVFRKLLTVENKLLDFATFHVLKTNLEWTPELANVGLQVLIFRGTGPSEFRTILQDLGTTGSHQEGRPIFVDIRKSESKFRTILQDLEEHGAQLNCVDGLENSLLHFAARSVDSKSPRYDLETLKFLVEVRGMDVELNRKNYLGETPLHAAAAGGNFKILKYLIDKGIDIYQKDKHMRTFLHLWIRLGPQEVHELVQLLIGNGLSKIFDFPGGEHEATPLQLGIQHWGSDFREETLELLHSNQINFNAKDKNGNTVLTYYLAGGGGAHDEDYLDLLINRYGADPTHVNNFGDSLLHIAANCSGSVAVEFCIKLDVLCIKRRNQYGDTPLHCAVMLGRHYKTATSTSYGVVQALRRLLGLDNIHRNEDTCPSIRAGVSDNGRCRDIMKKCELLIEYGADIHAVNNEGLTSLEIYKKCAEQYNPEHHYPWEQPRDHPIIPLMSLLGNTPDIDANSGE